MWSEKAKTLLFVAWAVAICVGAIALEVTSLPWWMAVVCLAVVPPLVARIFWRTPEQTLSEAIHKAR